MGRYALTGHPRGIVDRVRMYEINHGIGDFGCITEYKKIFIIYLLVLIVFLLCHNLILQENIGYF
jgi:hypothetical protein